MSNKKSVLVTGGAAGIGAGICRRLARDGYAVTIGDISVAEGKKLAEEIGADFVKLDVTSPEDVEAAIAGIVSKHGQLDALVNNAGVLSQFGPIGEQSIDEWKRVMSINLDGVFYGMKFALSQMIKQPSGGNIVNIGSMNGFRGLVNMGAYVPSKWAMRGLTAMAAVEYSQKNIRVNSVAPTTTQSSIVDEWIANQPDPALAVDQATSMNAQPGMVQPEDIANATTFLLSDEARYITGVTLPVDAGALARMPNAKEQNAVK
jgi:NAD(P)-dependent dehydrogenase (short-subunit alcohol dehydrogenase family)